MAPGVVAKLELRVGCQPAGLVRVGAHPIPTMKNVAGASFSVRAANMPSSNPAGYSGFWHRSKVSAT
jgi:hypothetical protein